jgi:hypothetical protein
MIQKKPVYHEEHEGHEVFSCDCPMIDVHQQGKFYLSKQDAAILRGLRVLRGSNEVSA